MNEKRYIAEAIEFQRRWWRAIRARPEQSITDAAKDAALEAAKSLGRKQPSIMAVSVGLEWLASAVPPIEAPERVAELKRWFDGLGLEPKGTIVAGEFADAIRNLEATQAAIARASGGRA